MTDDEPTTLVPLTDWDMEVLLKALEWADWADDDEIEEHNGSIREKLYAGRERLRGR